MQILIRKFEKQRGFNPDIFPSELEIFLLKLKKMQHNSVADFASNKSFSSATEFGRCSSSTDCFRVLLART
jgi:hypothetical protein